MDPISARTLMRLLSAYMPPGASPGSGGTPAGTGVGQAGVTSTVSTPTGHWEPPSRKRQIGMNGLITGPEQGMP